MRCGAVKVGVCQERDSAACLLRALVQIGVAAVRAEKRSPWSRQSCQGSWFPCQDLWAATTQHQSSASRERDGETLCRASTATKLLPFFSKGAKPGQIRDPQEGNARWGEGSSQISTRPHPSKPRPLRLRGAGLQPMGFSQPRLGCKSRLGALLPQSGICGST